MTWLKHFALVRKDSGGGLRKRELWGKRTTLGLYLLRWGNG